MAFFGRSRATQNLISRRVFYWCLATSYLIIASTVIFLTLGYRYSFPDSGFFYTGSVNFKVEPSDSNIFINGKEPSVRHIKNFINDSRHITGLRSGLHTISATSPGYKQWEKEVGVRSGFATEFWNVILLKESYDPQVLPIADPRRVFFTPSGELLAYAQDGQYLRQDGSDGQALYVPLVNTETRLVEEVYRIGDVSFTNNRTTNIEWSTTTRFLAVPVIVDLSKTSDSFSRYDLPPTSALPQDYVIIDRTKVEVPDLELSVSSDSLEAESLSESFSLTDIISSSQSLDMPESEPSALIAGDVPEANSLRMLRWHPQRKNVLFVLYGNILLSIDLSEYRHSPNRRDFAVQPLSGITVRQVSQNVAAYDFADEGLFLLRTDGSIERSRDFDPQNAKQFAQSTTVAPAESLRLVSYDSDRVLIINDDRGSLEIYNANDGLLTQKTLPLRGVTGAQFSNDGKKVMISTQSSAHVYFTRDWLSQPARSSGELHHILETEGNIHAIDWTPDYEHLVISIDQGLYLAELDNRGSYRAEQIIRRGVGDQNMYMDRRNFKLYYTDYVADTPLEATTPYLHWIDFPYEK